MRRRSWLAISTVLLLVAGVGAFAVWLAQDRLLHIALERAVSASAGRLSVERAHGALFEGARIARLQWRDPNGPSVDLRDLRLSWRWRDLLDGRLVISELTAQELILVPGAGDAALALPVSIGLPLPLTLQAVRLARLRIEPVGGAPTELRDITLRADYAPGRYRIESLSLRTPWGVVSGQASLADASPFRLAGWLSMRTDWRAAALGVGVSGTLADFDWQALALVRGPPEPASLTAGGKITLFATRWFGPVALRAVGLSAQDLDLSGRQALIDGEGELIWLGETPLQGAVARLTLRNRQPAPIDLGGVPVRTAQGLFRWQAGQWRIESLQAQINAAPVARTNLSGLIAIDPARELSLPWITLPGLQAELRVTDVDARALDSRLPAGRISGRVNIDQRRFDIDLADASRGGAAIQASGTLEGDRLLLANVSVASLPGLVRGRLQAKGSIQVVAPFELAVKGSFAGVELRALQALRPDLIATPLAGSLDGRWELAGVPGGARQPSLPASPAARPATAGRALAGVVDIDKGSLQGQAVRGHAQGRLEGDHVVGLTLALEVGANRLRADGAVGLPGDRLRYELDAPAVGPLALLAGLAGLQGSVSARGTWQGTSANPSLAIEASASRLRLADASLALATFSAQLDERRLMVKGQARDLLVSGQRIEAASIQAEGTPAQHRANIELSRGAHQLVATLEGALALPRWTGQIRELALRGPLAARLREPVTLAVSPDSALLGAALIEGEFGTIRLSRGQWQPGRLAAAGQASLLRLASVADALGIERPVLPAGVDADAVRIDLSADLSGRDAQNLTGSLVAKLTPPAGFKGALDADLTLRSGQLGGTIEMELPTLAMANRWIGPEWSIDGRLRLSGTVSGSLAAPRLAGAVRGEALRMEQRSLGWRLGAGTLEAQFEGDRLQVKSLRLHSGQTAIDAALARQARPAGGADNALTQGAIDLSGDVRVVDRVGSFRLIARGAAVPLGPGQRLVVSGQADVSSQSGRFELKGQLRADEGLIELRGGDAPAMPADVEIVARATSSATSISTSSATAAARSAPAAGSPIRSNGRAPAGTETSLRLVSDLSIDLGENLRVRGSGVDARLSGVIALRGSLPDAPRAFGTVRVRDGTYAAYGQKLQIERGRIVFNGPLDNPTLDLVALRRGLPVEAGVALTGTVLTPRVRLTSRPDVADAEKLSWLVLGVPLEGAQAGAETAALQAAAATLFGGNDGGLARALGLDVLTVRSSAGTDSFTAAPGLSGFMASGPVPGQVAGTTVSAASVTTQSVVAIGKRLSSRLLVTYEQGLRGVWNLLRIQYDITSRLSLRAQTGSESAIDVLYRFSFD